MSYSIILYCIGALSIIKLFFWSQHKGRRKNAPMFCTFLVTTKLAKNDFSIKNACFKGSVVESRSFQLGYFHDSNQSGFWMNRLNYFLIPFRVLRKSAVHIDTSFGTCITPRSQTPKFSKYSAVCIILQNLTP